MNDLSETEFVPPKLGKRQLTEKKKKSQPLEFKSSSGMSTPWRIKSDHLGTVCRLGRSYEVPKRYHVMHTLLHHVVTVHRSFLFCSTAFMTYYARYCAYDIKGLVTS